MFLTRSQLCLAQKPLFNTGGPDALIRAVAFALVIALLPVATVSAQGSDEQRRAAIAEAMGKAGGQGKVISVKPQETSNGEPGFRVRILTDGRVRTFDVAAESGN